MIEISSESRSVRIVQVETDSDDPAIFVGAPIRRRWPAAVLVGILLGVAGVLAAVDRSVGIDEDAGVVLEPPVETRPVEPVVEPSNWMSTWPDPPEDHAPIVIGRPAIGTRLLADPPGHTLLYMNTIDRPTVVDLVRSRRQELAISPLRSRDLFLIEDGEVVDDDPMNPDLPAAGARAITVYVHQPSSGDPRSFDVVSSLPGPHLCLGSDGCPGIDPFSGTVRLADQSVEHIALDAHPELEAMFESGRPDGANRFVVVTTPSGDTSKIPIPRPGTTLWLISDL